MNPDHSRLEALLEAALERADADEREAFLVEACGGDVELIAKVRRLIAAHEGAESFLEPGEATDTGASAAATTEAVTREAAGEVIGRYKLLQRLGEGGMGEVWMAEQGEPVRRRVALKIIKLGMATKEVIGRFEAERQALAMMEHPKTGGS